MLSLPTLVSFLAAAALLYFLVTRFDVDLGATWRQIRGSNPLLYLLAFVSYYTSFLLRGWRWRMIAANAGIHRTPGARLPSIPECSLFILLGWFANSVGWLRVGDAYRAYVLGEASRGGFSACLGTVVAERVLDVVVIFAMLLVALAALALERQVIPSPLFLLVALALVVAGILAVVVMARFGVRLARLLPKRFRGAYEGFHRGTLGSFRQLPAVTALGIGGWLLEVGRLFLVVKALGLTLSFPLAVFVALVHAILTTVPLTPGGLGIAEPGIVGVLALGLPRGSAITVAVLDRSISYLSIVVFGGLAFALHYLLRLRGSRAAAPQAQER